MVYFCVDDNGRCFPRNNGFQFPTPVSIKTGPHVLPNRAVPIEHFEKCFGQTQLDIPASKGASQEDKSIKRKRTSVKGDAKPLVFSRRKRCRPQPRTTGESHKTEPNSGIQTLKEGDDQGTEQQFCEEKEVNKEFSALREEEDRVNEKKDRLLQDYDDQFRGIIQLVQDNRENLRSRLTDVRQHSAKVTPKSKEVETRLRNLRLAAKDKCCTVIKAEKEKRLKTETDLRLEEDRHSKLYISEKAKSAILEREVQFERTRCESLIRDLQTERPKREKLESDREKLEWDLKSENTKLLKLDVDIASERARCRLLEEEAKTHEAAHVKVQEEIQLERGKRLKLEEDIQSEKGKRLKLEADVRLSEQKIESERAKLVCQICLEAIRDTMILPCTHFLYCNRCLVRHKLRSNTCPTCRGSMTALLHCHLVES